MEEFSESPRNRKDFYRKCLIRDIRLDDDKIQITGTAAKVNPSQEFELTDGSGVVKVREIPDNTDKIKNNEIYRVFGKYSIDPLGAHYLAAEMIQEQTNFNLETYIQTLELMKKYP